MMGLRILSAASAAVVACVAFGLLSVGCDRPAGPGATTQSASQSSDYKPRPSPNGNVFTFINRGDIITLDLNQMSYLQDFRVTYALREGLYKPDPKTLEPKLCLARDVKLSDDKKTWTFTLIDGAKWSNGDPVTAKDFVFSWRLMLESPGQYSSLYFYIQNAREYYESYKDGGPMKFDDVGIKSPDDKTIVVTLNNPVPYLPDLLTFPVFYPRNEKSMESFKQTDAKGRVSYDPAYTQAQNVVTNGPYILKNWISGREVFMVPNPNYRDRANVKLDGIKMIVNNDAQSAFVQYENGEVDWMADVSAEIGFKLKKQGRPDLHVADAFGTSYLSVNCGENVPELNGKKNPLADQRVRQALAMTIDKNLIVKNLTRMGEKPADRFVPAMFYKNWTSKTAPGFDPEGAKKILADAGYPDGKGFTTLSIVYSADSPTRRDTAEFLKNQWKKYLNITVELRPMESKGARNYITDKQYTLALSAWYGDYADASTWTDKYLKDAENNDSNWEPPEYNALCAKAETEPDEAKRQQLLVDAESMLNEQLPVIPLYYYVNFTLMREEVKGLPLNARNTTIWDDVHLERAK